MTKQRILRCLNIYNLDNRKNVKIKDLPLVKVREFGRSYIK